MRPVTLPTIGELVDAIAARDAALREARELLRRLADYTGGRNMPDGDPRREAWRYLDAEEA
jgi:hypothetical protein